MAFHITAMLMTLSLSFLFSQKLMLALGSEHPTTDGSLSPQASDLLYIPGDAWTHLHEKHPKSHRAMLQKPLFILDRSTAIILRSCWMQHFLFTESRVLVLCFVMLRLDSCNLLLASLPLRPIQLPKLQNASCFSTPSHRYVLFMGFLQLPASGLKQLPTKPKNRPAPTYLKAIITHNLVTRSFWAPYFTHHPSRHKDTLLSSGAIVGPLSKALYPLFHGLTLWCS